MWVEKQNSNESSEKQINKPKKTEQETQKAVENVKQNISKAKEAHKSGDIETQVWPILEKFWISEKRVDTIINRLSKLNDKSREALINQIKSWNKDLAIKIIDRLAPEGNVNKEINQNKTEINDNNAKIQQVKTEEKQVKTEEKQVKTEEKQVKTEEVRVINKIEENKDLERNYNNLRNIAKNLDSSNSQYRDFKAVLEKFYPITEENKKEFISELKQALSPKVLASIAKEVWVNTPEYKEFKNTLISLEWWSGSYFKSQFEAIERVGAEYAKDFWKLWVDRAGGKTDLDWNLKFDSGNSVIKVDKEGKRSLSLKGSDYELKSDVADQEITKKIDESTNKLQEKLEPINKELWSIEELQKFMEKNKDLPIEEIQKFIFLNFKEKIDISDLQFLRTKEELSLRLEKRGKELQKEKNRLVFSTNEFIKNLLQQNAIDTEKKDFERKKVLDFLNKIWFDLIPQKVSENIFKMINESSSYKMKLWLSDDINIAEWKFWIQKQSDGLQFKDKKAFIKLVNKMLTWTEDLPNTMTDSGTISFFNSAKDKKEWNINTSKKEYINTQLWASPQFRIMENLGIGI